jgi:hypothetical protein
MTGPVRRRERSRSARGKPRGSACGFPRGMDYSSASSRRDSSSELPSAVVMRSASSVSVSSSKKDVRGHVDAELVPDPADQGDCG